MDYILNFEAVDKHSLPLVGGKNASLGEMIKAGIRVPPGFAVTTETYQRFMADAGINENILNTLSGLNVENVDALNKVAAEVQESI